MTIPSLVAMRRQTGYPNGPGEGVASVLGSQEYLRVHAVRHVDAARIVVGHLECDVFGAEIRTNVLKENAPR